MTHVAARARVPKKALIVFAVVAAIMLGLAAVSVVRGIVHESRRMQVVEVLDGNTVVVDANGEHKTVKMAGVQSSIRNPDGLRGGPNMCLGEKSHGWLRDRLVQGATAEVDLEEGEDGQQYATFHLAGKDVNTSMAEAGMAAPTGTGVNDATATQIDEANELARSTGAGLYDVEESCTYNSMLFEAEYKLDSIPEKTDNTVKALDKRSREVAEAVDGIRLIQEDVEALEKDGGDFEDLAWHPAKEDLKQKADEAAEKGLQRLRELNDRRNQITAG